MQMIDFCQSSPVKGKDPAGLEPELPLSSSASPIDAFVAMSEILESGVVVVGLDGNVAGCNSSALKLLQEGDGIRRKGEGLTASAPEDASKLATAIAQALREQQGLLADKCTTQLISIRRCGRQALTCAVTCARAVVGPTLGGPSAVLFVVDPEFRSDEGIREVCSLHGLTPTETEVALYLVEGFSTADIALAMALKEETVRAYLKHIYGKTDANRQSALVQLLLSSRLPISLPGTERVVAAPSKSAAIQTARKRR